MKMKIESVFVGSATSGRPMGAGRLYGDKELFAWQRTAMAERARQARNDGEKWRIEMRRYA